jgi:uncharacterized protein YndB with AHSA1/START domain
MIMHPQPFKKSVVIRAALSIVWDHLTTPDLIVKWMGEKEMDLKINTDWQVGHPIIIKGFHHITFENKGKILQFEPYKTLQYSHLSSISRLPDKPENHSVITFNLDDQQGQTKLTITVENFPNDNIYKHLQLYWNVTAEVIKQQAEKAGATSLFS